MLRYRTEDGVDGLPSGEGVFLPCSFWLVDCIGAGRGGWRRPPSSSSGCSRVRNDLGLLAEEYDPDVRRLLGNFPQAFSHIALVNSAYNLARPGMAASMPDGVEEAY